MSEPRLFGRGVRMSRDHRLIPMFDLFGGVCLRILTDPFPNRFILFQTMNGIFEGVAIDFLETEQMLVEANSFVIVAVEQAFSMELCLVDQARQMDIAAKFFVRTAGMQSSHEMHYVAGGWGRRGAAAGAVFF